MADVLPDRPLPELFTRCFFRAAEAELGPYCLKLLLRNAGLLSGPFETLPSTSFQEPAWDSERKFLVSQFTSLLGAIHSYYGTGARGILTRVGRRIWNLFLKDAHLAQRSNLLALRILPPLNRRLRCLEQVATLMHQDSKDVQILVGEHELSLVESASPAVMLQGLPNPTNCWLMVGLIEEALYWVCGSAPEVDETACRANGAPACHFQIRYPDSHLPEKGRPSKAGL